MNRLSYLFLLFSVFGFGQTITFNDPDLLIYLTTKNCVDTDGDGVFDSDADFNNNGQIELSEAQQVIRFKFNTEAHDIQDIGGFENFSELELLEVTTIDIPSLDLSIWQSLQWLRLSSSIDSFVFDNPVLAHFELQNVGFNNPLFDLTNLPSLEYVRVQSNFITDSLIFGTHNQLEELRILAGTYSNLNLTGMPALKYLTIADYTGTSLDISNCTQLEEFIFRYNEDLTEIIGDDASSSLAVVDFIQENEFTIPSNFDLEFNNQNLIDVEVRGVKSFSLTNNVVDIGRVQLYAIRELVQIHNSQFAYVGGLLDGTILLHFFDESEVDFNNVIGVKSLRIQDLNTSSTIDFSTTISEDIHINSSSIEALILKNGVIQQFFNSDFDTTIQYICIDDEEQAQIEGGYQNTSAPVEINSFCTFFPGGEHFIVNGDLLMDLGSGCASNPEASFFDVQFSATDGTTTSIFYPSNNNTYTHYLLEGNYSITAAILESDYWTLSPSNFNLSFPADPSPFTQDICIIPDGVHNDVEIVLLPITDAIAGFEAEYKLVFKNKGNTPVSGSIDLAFEGDFMDFLSASPFVDGQTQESLSWNYTNLIPFETREISFTMELNPPTDPDFPLNIGDILYFSAVINPVASDETPEDNQFEFYQEVTNSFDPNDITCLEGDGILLEQVGGYVHYLIRFENLGTANAVNIVVKDVLDTTKFDVTSFLPLNASHSFYTQIVNGNEVEFIFENINLPFNNNNDGYVLFKIKTLPNLVLGDSFENQAEIYFDFNFPIVTNIAETVVVEEILDTPENNIGDVALIPNPTNGVMHIKCASKIVEFKVYDLNGRILDLKSKNVNGNDYQIDASDLSDGIYFVSVQSGTSTSLLKFIKN